MHNSPTRWEMVWQVLTVLFAVAFLMLFIDRRLQVTPADVYQKVTKLAEEVQALRVAVEELKPDER